MKPALEKFLLIAATLAAIGIFIFVALWASIKDKKTQMDNLFNSTNVPTSFQFVKPIPTPSGAGSSFSVHSLPAMENKVLAAPPVINGLADVPLPDTFRG